MLIKVLDYITTKKIASTASLADRLGLSEEMVKQLLMELANGGYLDLIEKESYTNSCDSCERKCADLKKSLDKGHLSVWMLTVKGKRAIKKLSGAGGALVLSSSAVTQKTDNPDMSG